MPSTQPHPLVLKPSDLPPRRADAHKGDFGHVLVIGGNYGMGGAVHLAAEAAARSGVGLTTVATRPEHVSAVITDRPEVMCYGIEDVKELAPLLARATVILLGTGLGQDDWAKALYEAALTSPLPKVIDADGLNLLAQHPVSIPNAILTPHPGEAARLLGCTTATIQQDRFAAAQQLQQRYGGVIVLKGMGTIVQSSNDTAVCTAGNPGMATGGMGDVLGGIIAGLLAQGLPADKAAGIGVLVHALAADQAAATGKRGLLASDLFPYLRGLLNPEDPPLTQK